ncbi:MAG: S-adenosylmethionine:tRNA ribosyltransferase-isomerase [Prevotellaceae bacterium]|jgi:S-adenosylmethionine:tRNA ribosyltransferase-isomerase|nr:S-adenosylmethionine:tRNA ribosyltransferase-isomerase [Prevotellaceae bacterium]
MQTIRNISVEDYNYLLPDERVAKFPLPERDSSKLLVFKDNQITESIFRALPDIVPEGSLMVFNNTKVIQARLVFHKKTGGRIEIFCLEPVEPADYAQAFAQTEAVTWLCMVGNLKKWKEPKVEKEFLVNDTKIILSAEIIENKGLTHHIRFSWYCHCGRDPQSPEKREQGVAGHTSTSLCNQARNDRMVTFSEILETIGELPIPPYLHRAATERDKETYQTVYSKIKGSVAAPTAGLHFTETVFNSLKSKSIQTAELTLHVGAGTFHPVKSAQIAEHEMHTEIFSISKSLIEKLLKKPVIAVGTTTVRTLESLYYLGVQIGTDCKSAPAALMGVTQWQPYEREYTLSTEKSLQNILDYMQKNGLETLTSHTQIMIVPSFPFRVVQSIVTNFHQPKSTLLLLVSAFAGKHWRDIYDYALANDFRFLSYGDSSILLKEKADC